MELLQTPNSYRPESLPESPYLRAQQEWDNRIGSAVVQAKNWRFAFFACFFLSLGLLTTNLVQLSQHKVIPMVISLGASGDATVLGKAGLTPYAPGEPQIKYFLFQFIKYVRTVPVDPVVIKSNWMHAYKFLRSEAAQTLNLITNDDEQSPLKRIGQETVSIEPVSVLFVPGSNSYQARWLERVFDKNGAQTSSSMMTGIFTVEAEEPKTEDEILINPLGIFIKSFTWSRDLEGAKS